MKKRLPKNQKRNESRRRMQKNIRLRFKPETKIAETPGFIIQTKHLALISSCCFVIIAALASFQISDSQHLHNNNCQHRTPISVVWPQKTGWKYNKPITGSSINKQHLAINQALKKDVSNIVKSTPMEAMVNEIAQRDRPVAAYLVGIAMKESKFGKFSPKKNGVECYNYWGYRGKENTTASGYSCFNSPKHAIAVVGSKIASMLSKGSKDPAQMISWKCGSSCAGHNPESVRKWIADVAINYYKLNPNRQLARNK